MTSISLIHIITNNVDPYKIKIESPGCGQDQDKSSHVQNFRVSSTKVNVSCELSEETKIILRYSLIFEGGLGYTMEKNTLCKILIKVV